MTFSKKDLDIILKYVVERVFKHKLSDYPELEEITGEEITPIVYNNTNKVLKLNDLLHVPAIKGGFDRADNRITDLGKSVDGKLEDMQNQIDGFDEHGVAVSNKFGADPHIGISQATLTDALNNVYHLLEEALDRTLLGFTWNVTPTYIYGEWPTTVHITAIPTNPENQFECIKLSVNGNTVDEVTEKVSTYSFDIDLQTTANIRMDAQVLGMPYYREETINHYDSFWMGGGSTYADIMNEAHNINFSEGTRLAKDVTVADGEHIIIMMGDAWVPAFIRADMNGAEIEFDEATVTIDGKNYKVLTSKSVFEAGTYNIDING